MVVQIEKQDLLILRSILKKYPYRFYVYGSRTKSNYKKFSDLDLCIMDDVSYETLFEIENTIAESDISIKVDIKRWSDMNEDFYSLIKGDLVPFE